MCHLHVLKIWQVKYLIGKCPDLVLDEISKNNNALG